MAERLRTLRIERGLTQQQIADTLGVDRTTYTKYETGASEPNIATIRRLAETFGVTIDYLLGNTNDPRGAISIDAFAAESDLPLWKLSEAAKAELVDFAKYLLSKQNHS